MINRLPEKDIPLQGTGVLVTRAREQADTMIRGLEALGAHVYHIPAINIEPVENPEGLRMALENLGSYDALIFTSVNGVEIFVRRLREAGLNAVDLPPAICVGPGTASAWKDVGGLVGAVPDTFSAEGILAELDPDLRRRSYLVLRPGVVQTDLGTALRKREALVDEVILYNTASGSEEEDHLMDLLDRDKIAVATFMSPSSIRGIKEILGGVESLRSVICLCIGPTTARAARDAGLSDVYYPDEYTVEGMLRMLPSLLEGKGKRR